MSGFGDFGTLGFRKLGISGLGDLGSRDASRRLEALKVLWIYMLIYIYIYMYIYIYIYINM